MGNVASPAVPHYLTPVQAAEVLGVNVQTLARWRWQGTGPDWIKVTSKTVRYERAALDRHLAGRSRDQQAVR